MTDSENDSIAEKEDMGSMNSKVLLVTHDTLSNLEKQRQNNDQMCDVILQVENEEFPAHRLVLSASSEYFLKMFTIEMKEKNSKKIPMKSVTPTAMSEILKSIYTQQIAFSKTNISDILHGASLMQFSGIVNAAEAYIKQTITMENCFWFRELVLGHPFETLKEVVISYFLLHMEEVSTHLEFLNFTFDEVDKIFSSNDLCTNTEEAVFEMLVKWVNANVEDRKEYFPSLFKHVRLQFVPIDYIIDCVRENKLVRQFNECRAIVENEFIYHIRPFNQTKQLQIQRNCVAADAVALFYYNEKTQAIYDFANSAWSIKIVPHGLTNEYAVASNGSISAFCCSTTRLRTKVVQFNGVEWIDLPDIDQSRKGAAAVYFKNELFVFGGETAAIDRHFMYHDKEKFCENFGILRTQTWKYIENPLLSRSFFAAQALENKIYLIGGYKYDDEAKRKEVCSETMVYQPSTNTWENANPLYEARTMFGCAILNLKIYVLGGIGRESSNINTVEIFDPQEKLWTNGGSVFPGPISACTISNRMYFVAEQYDKLWEYKVSTNDTSAKCVEVARTVPGKGLLIPISKQSKL